jgi:alcohol dehydrogenase
MARALGCADASAPEDFLAALEKLQKDCGVFELKLSDYDIKESDIPGLVKNAFDTMGQMFGVDPERLSPEDVEDIYRKSYR